MANGNFGGGTGAKSNPYLIEDALDLKAMSGMPLNSSYLVKNDIDCSSLTGYVPPGTEESSFSGSFNGGNFKIKNLTVTTKNASLLGIVASSGYVTNIILENCNFSGSGSCGSIAGNISGSSSSFNLADNHVKNTTVYSNNSFAGGIVGLATNDFDLRRCSFDGNVSGTYAGGIVAIGGHTSTFRIFDCHTSGIIKARTAYAGGIQGRSSYGTYIYRCLTTAEVYGFSGAFGIIADGFGTSSYKMVYNSYCFSQKIGRVSGSTSPNDDFGYIASKAFGGSDNYYIDGATFIDGV